ncbi:type IV secretion system DNA-binding domain-containing protein, partial [Burkholderia cepacia]|uniref:type IV secretion system DNA-binding domain-containing protein n=1 Tax=Burkholderia cepacia TaxID=292 RepID=UPI002ABDA00F
MQRHEIRMLQACLAIVGLMIGLALSMHMGGYALLAFPMGTIRALGAIPHRPWLLAGLIPGGILAALACWACQEYLFNGFEGYRYARFIRGMRMENAHLLNWRIKQHNAQLRDRAKRESRSARKRRERDDAREHRQRPQSTPAPRRDETPADEEPRPAVSLCGIEMPTDLETQNIIVVGAPGSGKSQGIGGLVADAVRREDRLVIVDPNGTMMSQFYLPGDVVINPYDARCVGWSLFNEADHEFDYERLAHSAIPPQPTKEAEEWASFARDVLSVTMSRLNAIDMQDMRTLVDILVRKDRAVLKKFLEGSEAAGFFGRDAEKATASII